MVRYIVIPVTEGSAERTFARLKELLFEEAVAAEKIHRPRSGWLRWCHGHMKLGKLKLKDAPAET